MAMNQTTVMILAVGLGLGACNKPVERRDVQKLVNELWDTCLIVEAKDVTIESQDRESVRYAYVLRMRADGPMVDKGIGCPMPKQKMVEMFFNKDMADLKAGTETTVTQEAAKQ